MSQHVSHEFVFQHYGIRKNLPEHDAKNVVRLADDDSTNQRAVTDFRHRAKQRWEQQLEQQYIDRLSRRDQHSGVPDLTQYVSEQDIKVLLEEKP